jgi:hypothetical protein
MKRKILLAAKAALVATGMLSLSACFEERSYPVYPAYSYAPGYTYGAPPVIIGDYDDYHRWHDRDWWVDHNRGWVENHRHEWLEQRAPVHHGRDVR